MKLLAVDIGNSEIKRAVIHDGEVVELKRDATSDVIRVASDIAASTLPVALSSVRKSATETIRNALLAEKRDIVLEVDHQISKPVSGFYKGMGADRVCDIASAWTKYRDKPVLVIGLGTATTCTAASSAGIFRGGFITLGLGSLCNTLTEALPELPSIDPKLAGSLAPAFDVYSSICKGTVSAHVGIIEKWVDIFREQLGDEMVVVATGGWSEILAPLCPGVHEVDPYLTAEGIWTIALASGWTSESS